MVRFNYFLMHFKSQDALNLLIESDANFNQNNITVFTRMKVARDIYSATPLYCAESFFFAELAFVESRADIHFSDLSW